MSSHPALKHAKSPKGLGSPNQSFSTNCTQAIRSCAGSRGAGREDLVVAFVEKVERAVAYGFWSIEKGCGQGRHVRRPGNGALIRASMAVFGPQWLRAVVIFAVCKDVFVFSVLVGDG